MSLSAHVLLNLLNEVRKIDKIRGWPSILYLFHNKRFNNTGEHDRYIDSIYHITLKLF